MKQAEIPDFFVYGEPSRALDVGFLHVETVRERNNIHLGKVLPHKHAQMGQITFWTSGRGVYRIEDQVWDFSAPTASFVPSNVVHGFTIEPGTDALVVSVADGMLKQLAAQTSLALDGPVFVGGEPQSPAWTGLADTLAMIAREYRQGVRNDDILTNLVAVSLSYIARLNADRPSIASSPALALALAFRRSVDEHFREGWPMEKYVDLLGTTPHLLDKASRQVLKMPPKEVVLSRRLLEAKRLLLFTIRSVEDIALETGFRDPAYFSRFFRLREGEAPAAWRRRNG
ncbi:helix-turn-helix domain-containing protein [Devosia sp. D6-9]|nr:helix-turn-helix domain-containing protein [Devosia sp. D6-9]